ncbi:MAG: hypothetical protein ACW99J_16725 [Candidatus Thorarchaeota archaeon]
MGIENEKLAGSSRVGNLLLLIGALGALCFLPSLLILNGGPEELWGYEATPGDITFFNFYYRNGLLIMSVSMLIGSILVAVGLLGFLLRHRNPLALIGTPAFLLSTYYTWIWYDGILNIILHPPMTGSEWLVFLGNLLWGVNWFMIGFVVLGITAVVTRQSRYVGVVTIVISIVAYAIQYLIEGPEWIHWSIAIMCIAYFGAVLSFLAARREP